MVSFLGGVLKVDSCNPINRDLYNANVLFKIIKTINDEQSDLTDEFGHIILFRNIHQAKGYLSNRVFEYSLHPDRFNIVVYKKES